MELTLALSIAMNIQQIVKHICASIRDVNATYNEIMKDMSKRELLRIKNKKEMLQLNKSELAFVNVCSTKMLEIMKIGSVEELDKNTGHPYISLKILLSLYRRIRTLAKYQLEGKADFRNEK
jgi:hypothetical protein